MRSIPGPFSIFAKRGRLSRMLLNIAVACRFLGHLKSKDRAFDRMMEKMHTTKLARSTKARALIQLCFYSDLMAAIQRLEPRSMHVVPGGGAKPEPFRVQRYIAYFRKVRRDFEEASGTPTATTQSQLSTVTPVRGCLFATNVATRTITRRWLRGSPETNARG